MSAPADKRRPRWRIVQADCLKELPRLEAQSVDAIVTDPPYGINLGGLSWDGRAIRRSACSDLALRARLGTPGRTCGGSAFGSPSSYAGSYDFSLKGALAFQAFCSGWASECLRVLKPGGHLVVFGGPRTAHRLACGVEEAGFQLRDVLMWLYGQGFPKSLNLSRAMKGWGTALRPSYEPILLARKPLELPTRENARRHGTGALHIDACRPAERTDGCAAEGRRHARARVAARAGRWPPNLVLSHARCCSDVACAPECPAALLGERQRFFYCAKASRREREAGCERLSRRTIQTFQIGASNERRAQANPVANVHPTVKPIELMRWLVRLITPADGLVLDPFAGSASTGAAALLEGARFLGIEREAEYVPIARARLRYWAAQARDTRAGK
jgi:DNA modification methylase